MRTALLLLVAVATAGCGTASVAQPAARPSATTARAVATRAGPYADCPVPVAVPPGTSEDIDYLDFVDANGYQYVGALSTTLTDKDRGGLQLRVRCSISQWSDAFNQGTTARDGDAAFLPAGTGVYAVKGSSPLCTLMARSDDGWHLYAASASPGCKGNEAPAATALPSRPTIDASLGYLNDVTHLMPPTARDGDASFLPAGTPVYAVKGRSTSCVLMAAGADGWSAYTPRPVPAGCPTAPNG